MAKWLQNLASQGLKASSQARALSAIKQWLAYLVREGHLKENPAKGLLTPKQGRYLPYVPTPSQIEALLAAPDVSTPIGQRDYALLELLYASGVRASEVCTLRPDDINLRTGVVRACGKGAKERLVPMGRQAIAAIETYISYARPVIAQRGRCSLDLLFLGQRGAALSRSTLFVLVRRYGAQVGLGNGLGVHSLRHAFATHLLRGGADLRVLQEMLGHADISTTEIYTQVLKDHLRESVDRYHPLGLDSIGKID